MDEPRRRSYWNHWTGFAARWGICPYLTDCSPYKQSSILASFAVGVRNGDFGRGHQITTQSVDRALRAVGQTIQLAGLPDPTKIYGGRERTIQLRRLLDSYRRADPPPKPQLAIPVSVIEHLQAGGLPRDSKSGAVADLATIAFFFLLRVGEYTMPVRTRRTRTVQFRVSDITFYSNGLVISNRSPLSVLLQADGVAMCISNQKNGTRGETIHQHALPDRAICPVAALARRVSTVVAASGSTETPLSLFEVSGGQQHHVTAAMIRAGVRTAVRDLQLHRQGIKASSVGSHSLRAGGAMAMKLNGCDLITIMKQGRWTSLTFLTYIHNQIAHLGANIINRMANQVPFFSF